MKKEKKILYLTMVILSVSCAPIYIPNQVNTPLLKEKGDANAAVSIGTSGYDLQLSGSPATNLGLMLNTSYYNFDSSHTHFMMEAAGGYYTCFSDRTVFEVYAGGGYGFSESFLSGSFETYKGGHFTKAFIQPSIGFAADYFEGAFSIRSVFINFPKYGNGVFMEPVLTARFGLKMIKFATQMGLSFDITGEIDVDYSPFIFNFGLVYQLKSKARASL